MSTLRHWKMVKVHKINELICDVLFLEPQNNLENSHGMPWELVTYWRLLTGVKRHEISLHSNMYILLETLLSDIFTVSLLYRYKYSLWTAKRMFECKHVTIYLHPFLRLRILQSYIYSSPSCLWREVKQTDYITFKIHLVSYALMISHYKAQACGGTVALWLFVRISCFRCYANTRNCKVQSAVTTKYGSLPSAIVRLQIIKYPAPQRPFWKYCFLRFVNRNVIVHEITAKESMIHACDGRHFQRVRFVFRGVNWRNKKALKLGRRKTKATTAVNCVKVYFWQKRTLSLSAFRSQMAFCTVFFFFVCVWSTCLVSVFPTAFSGNFAWKLRNGTTNIFISACFLLSIRNNSNSVGQIFVILCIGDSNNYTSKVQFLLKSKKK